MNATECATTIRTHILFGRTRYSASCTTCGVPCGGWTEMQAFAEFDAHKAISATPAEVLARPITHSDVEAFPEYFISGRGRRIASATDCGHGYYLTDSCPCCP